MKKKLIVAIIGVGIAALAGCADSGLGLPTDKPSVRDRTLEAVADSGPEGRHAVSEDPDLVWDIINDSCDMGVYATAIMIADVSDTDEDVDDMATVIGAGMDVLCPEELE